MSSPYTSNVLISDIKTLSMQPDAELLLTDANINTFLSFQLQSIVVPLIDSTNEEYFVTFQDTAWDGETFIYAIPTRAVGNKIKDVVWVDTNGYEYSLPRLTPEQLKISGYYGFWSMGTGFTSLLYGFYLKDDKIYLYLGQPFGTSSSYPTLRIKYYRRPSRLILEEDAGEIRTIISENNQVIVGAAPIDWEVGDKVDFIKGTPMFSSRGDDYTITEISSNTITFNDLPDELEVGDWVSLANTSPIPQIPYDGFPLLTQLGVIKSLEAIKDTAGLKNALSSLPEIKQSFLQVITPRADANPIKLMSNNGIFNA